MDKIRAGIRFQRNEYGYPVIESDDAKACRISMAEVEQVPKATAAIFGLICALGLIGWAWTFLGSH